MELNSLREEYKKLKTKKAAFKKKSVGNVDAVAVAQALSSDSEVEEDEKKNDGSDGSSSDS